MARPSRQAGSRQKADAERQKLEREAALKVAPSPRVAPTLSQDQACKRDAEKLARLRASQSREDVVRLERELVQLRALVTDVSQAPTALTQQVQRIERAIAVLHANLVAARQWLATFLPRET